MRDKARSIRDKALSRPAFLWEHEIKDLLFEHDPFGILL
jgi:hypothetical protein